MDIHKYILIFEQVQHQMQFSTIGTMDMVVCACIIFVFFPQKCNISVLSFSNFDLITIRTSYFLFACSACAFAFLLVSEQIILIKIYS